MLTKTYTKKLTRNVLLVAIISGNIPYVLSFLNKEPVSSLGEAWVVSVVAVSLGYLVRGYKDSKAESDDDYRRGENGTVNGIYGEDNNGN